MPTPQLLNDIIRLLLQMMPAMALICLVLAGIALRMEGGSTFVVGGSFTKWVLWGIIMLSLPQFLLWFNFFGLPVPIAGGAIATPWLSGFQVDVSTFVNDFLIGRLTIVVAAYFVLRALLDAVHGGSPLASVLVAMFFLAIPTTADLLTSLETGTRFSAVDVLDGLWTYLAGRIMPVAAGLAVIAAIFNFVKVIFNVLTELRERLIVKLAILAGMRPGEIFGLRRGRFGECFASIHQRVYRGIIDTPKTEKSTRTAALSPGLRRDFEFWLRSSPDTGPEGWLFPSETMATPLSRDNVMYRNIRPVLKKAGFGWVDFHVMRRTHSSLMRELGVDPKIVADQQGHTLDVNLNVYTETSVESRIEAVEKLESAFVN